MLYNMLVLALLYLSVVPLRQVYSKNANGTLASGPRERIVSGLTVHHRQHPYMAALVHINSILTCGGAVITCTVIATACHCVCTIKGSSAILNFSEDYKVIAGIDDLFGNSPYKMIRTIREFRAHPKCRSEQRATMVFDSGVVLLKNPLIYNVEIQPISMFSYDWVTMMNEYWKLVNQGAKCVISGWGRANESVPADGSTFLAANLRLLTPTSCRSIFCPISRLYCDLDIDRWQQACTMPSEEAVPCIGDSGGALVCNGYLFGVFSWNIRCESNQPQIFANPAAVLYLLLNIYNAEPSPRISDRVAQSSSLTTSCYKSVNGVILIIGALITK